MPEEPTNNNDGRLNECDAGDTHGPAEATSGEPDGGDRTQDSPEDQLEELTAEKNSTSDESPGANLSLDDLMDRLKQAEREIEDLNNRYLRALADYDNAVKRAKAEREGLRSAVICDFVSSLLPSLDNLDRAIESGESGNVQALVDGLKLVRSQILDVLEAEGIKCIEAVGTQFDPNKHDAVSVAELEEYEDNVVVEEFLKGYEANGRVIRPSMVKVNRKRN